jgi:Methylamine utilisation protein MauE
MVSVVVSLALGLVLACAAGLKLAGGASARAALATYGLHGRAATAAWGTLIGVEAVLAVAVAAGLGWATRAAALLLTAGAAAQLAALLAGRGGAPCACFGTRGRLGRGSVGRALAFAAAL